MVIDIKSNDGTKIMVLNNSDLLQKVNKGVLNTTLVAATRVLKYI